MSPVRRILVTAFCQTPGLASALRLIFPGVEVYARASLAKKDAKAEDVAQLLGQIDAWVNVEGGEAFFSGGAFRAANPNLKYVSIPLLEFAAFHPDLCSARDGAGHSVDYTSAIAVWAYKNRLRPADGARLYNRATFTNLGYLSEWDRSVMRLRALFEASDLAADFDRFYRRIKRLGVFMYTATHPRPAVLAELAKLIAPRLGGAESELDVDLPALDALVDFIWPVYPEIAEDLSLPGSGYVWQWGDGARIRGLGPFLAYSYQQYRSRNLGPAEIGVPGADLARIGQAVVTAS